MHIELQLYTCLACILRYSPFQGDWGKGGGSGGGGGGGGGRVSVSVIVVVLIDKSMRI